MNNTSGYSTLSMQALEATICSTDSSYVMGNNAGNIVLKQEGKIKAYVDFTEFNKNYSEYMEKHGVQELSDGSSNPSDSEDACPADSNDTSDINHNQHLINMVLDRQNSSSSNQSEDWEVISST